MVDVVVNDVMSLTNTTMDYNSFMFKDEVRPYVFIDIYWCGLNVGVASLYTTLTARLTGVTLRVSRTAGSAIPRYTFRT